MGTREMIDWNRPLVADVGDLLGVSPPIDGTALVDHANGKRYLHNQDGVACGIDNKYTLRNRPWRDGDTVVAVESGIRGEVKGIQSGTEGNSFILVSFDGGCSSLVPVDGIRYDYRRPKKPKEKPEQDEPYKPWSHYGYDHGTRDPHAELEALIADALETHEASKRTGDDALADDIAAHLYAYRGNRDGPTMPVARSIIAMVREHDSTTPDPDGPFPTRCNVTAIEMFAEERERAVAKARAEALEEAAATADGLRPAAGWSEQAANAWGCGCLDTARAIRALINKDSAND